MKRSLIILFLLSLPFIILACAGSRAVERPMPSVSAFSAEGIWQKAEYLFEAKEYEEAEAAFQEFLELHPLDSRAEEALWLIGISHVRRQRSFDRDQTQTELTIASLKNLLSRFPDSAHKAEAEKIILEARKRLARAEFSIAEFYFKKGAYKAAKARFQGVVDEYPDLDWAEKAGQYLKKL